jgi:hypothetical protein
VGDPKALFHIDTLRPTEIILQEAKIIERSQVSRPLAPKTMECFFNLLLLITALKFTTNGDYFATPACKFQFIAVVLSFSFFVSIKLSLS